MATFSIMSKFDVHKNQKFLEKARALEPMLHENIITLTPEPASMKKDDRMLYDFGDHHVGYLKFRIESRGSHPDAPAYLRIRMAEHIREFDEHIEDYQGWLGKGWFQEEYIHIDVFPQVIALPRRYALRYVEITVLDTSPKYQVVIPEISFRAVSAVEENLTIPSYEGDELLQRIDAVGCHTLADCMQSVFEDGPKRDCRMWLGDLRIQALTNYATFRNFDLVKRCLYLFAGLLFNENQISACIFMEPEEEPDDTFLLDYSLQFASALREYYEACNDRETLEELYPVMKDQILYAEGQLDDRGLITDRDGEFWCFLDWGDDLNKEAGGNAVYADALRDAKVIADILGLTEDAQKYEDRRNDLIRAINEHFYDAESGFYVSGKDRQISWHTQIWMILSGAAKDPEALLDTMNNIPAGTSLNTPYAYYYYALALVRNGRKEAALEKIKEYWGAMIQDGADTFYEVFDASNPNYSPYGSAAVNSYCHAWSCGVVAILREYFQ